MGVETGRGGGWFCVSQSRFIDMLGTNYEFRKHAESGHHVLHLLSKSYVLIEANLLGRTNTDSNILQGNYPCPHVFHKVERLTVFNLTYLRKSFQRLSSNYCALRVPDISGQNIY